MEIRIIDPADTAAIETFHRIYVEAGALDAPETFVAAPVAELINVISAPTERFRYTAFLGYDAGEVVASGWTAGFRGDNPDHMFVLPRVLPEFRRRGYGSEMLRRLEHHACEDRRRVLDAQARWGIVYGDAGTGSATCEFCRRHGFTLKQAEVIRSLELSGHPEPAIAFTQVEHGYELQAWSGRIPDRLVAAWAQMEASISTDAPSGDLDLQPQTPRIEAVRDDERIL